MFYSLELRGWSWWHHRLLSLRFVAALQSLLLCGLIRSHLSFFKIAERPRTKKFADLWSGEEARFIRAYRVRNHRNILIAFVCDQIIHPLIYNCKYKFGKTQLLSIEGDFSMRVHTELPSLHFFIPLKDVPFRIDFWMWLLQLDKNTFSYVLDAIRDRLTKVDVVGDTIPPEVRLAVCLSRLGRGEYFYNIAEDYGIGMWHSDKPDVLTSPFIRAWEWLLLFNHGLIYNNICHQYGQQCYIFISW